MLHSFRKTRLYAALLALLLTLSLLLSGCGLLKKPNDPEDTGSGSGSHEGASSTLSPEGEAEAVFRVSCLQALSALEAEGCTDVTGAPVDFAAYRALIESDGLSPEKILYTAELYSVYFVGSYRPISELYPDMMRNLVTLYDKDKIEGSEITDVVMNCYLDAVGDKYASYFTAKDYDEYYSDLTATYVGIGVQVLLQSDGYMEIIRVYADTPALEKGLLEGDIIVAVEGEDVAELGYYPTLARVRGEEGTSVNITVLRGDTRIDFTLTRKKLTEYSVEGKLLTANGHPTVGYIRISEFDDGTFPQFVELYRRLKNDGATEFVFDVRSNPGGKLEAIVAVLEFILPDGPIAKMNYKNDRDDYTISSLSDVGISQSTYNNIYKTIYDELGNTDHMIREPFAVLTNAFTASAGELFSSAIRDYANKGLVTARLIGEKTYGKGTGQTSIPLGVYNDKATGLVHDGSFVNVSIFYYDPPFEKNYEGTGVIPHDTVPLPESAQDKSVLKLTFEEDTQLSAALTWLAGQ